jgi:uncharacterized repeat protein (TIGR01451 family)
MVKWKTLESWLNGMDHLNWIAMNRTIALIITTLVFCSTAQANDGDEIILEDLGVTLDSSELELDQLTTPDLPDGAMPEVFQEEAPEAEPVSEEASEQPIPDNVKINYVNVSESFYRLTFNSETNIYTREATNEAKPGDLIEIVITAVNASDETVTDVEMINTIPAGPLQLLANSFKTNERKSLYLLSRNGQDFFPSDIEFAAEEIRFIQWLVLSLAPGESIDFSYRIQINQ